MYYLCSENKDADQVTTQLICTFVFACIKSRFSHDEAHMVEVYTYKNDEDIKCVL